MFRNGRTTVRPGVRALPLTRSTAQRVLEGCRQFVPGARRSVGWAIAVTALAIRIFTVRYGAEAYTPLTMRLSLESVRDQRPGREQPVCVVHHGHVDHVERHQW